MQPGLLEHTSFPIGKCLERPEYRVVAVWVPGRYTDYVVFHVGTEMGIPCLGLTPSNGVFM